MLTYGIVPSLFQASMYLRIISGCESAEKRGKSYREIVLVVMTSFVIRVVSFLMVSIILIFLRFLSLKGFQHTVPEHQLVDFHSDVLSTFFLSKYLRSIFLEESNLSWLFLLLLFP